MNHQRAKHQRRLRRRFRVSKRVRGTPERPRLCVFRTLKHMYAQVIDDQAGKTLVAASTVDKDLRTNLKIGGNKAAAQIIGKAIAERATAAGIKQVSFDRREFKYHGRIAALAEAAREAGLSF
jgi:large subunit ribosomal protein L18